MKPKRGKSRTVKPVKAWASLDYAGKMIWINHPDRDGEIPAIFKLKAHAIDYGYGLVPVLITPITKRKRKP